jgi:hypothetical protein
LRTTMNDRDDVESQHPDVGTGQPPRWPTIRRRLGRVDSR